jgi:glycosyltransferase involved in cell wall biosynthesis
MNVLIVNTYHYLRGGDCRHALGLGRMLERRGHEVHFFGMHDPRNLECADSRYFISNVDYREAADGRNPLEALRVAWRSIYSFEARRRMADMLRETKPDVAHLHSIRHHVTASVLPVLKARGVPVAWTLHDYKEICPNTNLYDGRRVCEDCRGGRYHKVIANRCKRGSLAASVMTYLEARINAWLGHDRYVDLYISPSRFLREKFIEFGYDPDRIAALPNFIEIDRYRPDYKRGDYLLYLGRLEKMKGLETLLEGFARARSAVEGLELRIAGTGTMEQEVRSFVNRRSVGGITLCGHVSGQELEDLTRGARAVVIPSVWYENYPYSCLEAMAYGRPVIASRIGGIPEQVVDASTGFLFTPSDPADLADRIVRLYSLSEEETVEMGRRGRARVEEINDPDVFMDRLLGIYGSLIAASRGRG